jgi:predicted Zn-dependent protease
MMKKPLLFLALALCFLPLAAQNSKVTSGVMAEQAGKTGEAITKLEEALAARELIKNPKMIAKAQYSLFKSYLRVASDTTLGDLRKQYPDAALLARANYDSALKSVDAKLYERQAILDNAESNLWIVLYNEGINAYVDEKYDRASTYFKAAGEVRPEHFLTQRMLGGTLMALNDTPNAMAALDNSIGLYKKRYIEAKPEDLATFKQDPNFMAEMAQDSGQIGYVYRQMAAVYNKQGQARKALDLLADGAKVVKDPDMALMELGIYQTNPDLFEEATSKFEAAIASDPKNENVKLAYASMLERNKRVDDAQKLYQQVYEQNPRSIEANYGLGAYYINRAAALSEERAKTNNDKKIDELNEQILGLLEKAYPYMKFLHEAQPTEREWLSQLVSISGNLGKMDEMNAYGEKLGKLQN